MKKFIILIYVALLGNLSHAQNVVSNGSFETKDGGNCPFETGFDAGASPAYWTIAAHHGYTPDYYFPCDSPGSAWYPGSNNHGCEYPLDGQSYTGLLAQVVESNGSVYALGSEYMQQELTLTGSQQYYVEFWVSAAEGTISGPNTAYTKNLGMYFTTNLATLSSGSNIGLHHLTPQIPNAFPASNFYNSISGWTKVSGTFTPGGSGSQIWYIVIGNFDSGLNNTPGTPNSDCPSCCPTCDPVNNYRSAYYFIDAVTIIPSNQAHPTYGPYVTGADLLCSGTEAYTLNNAAFGTTATWAVTPSGLFTSNSGTGTPASLTALGSGGGTLTFTPFWSMPEHTCKQKFMGWLARRTYSIGMAGNYYE